MRRCRWVGRQRGDSPLFISTVFFFFVFFFLVPELFTLIRQATETRHVVQKLNSWDYSKKEKKEEKKKKT